MITAFSKKIFITSSYNYLYIGAELADYPGWKKTLKKRNHPSEFDN
jgi:hypothetical protein